MQFIITVKDNGNGMPETIIRQLEEIREKWNTEKRRNTLVSLIFSKDFCCCMEKKYGLTVERVKPSGTAVTICIPKTKGEKGYESGNYR